mgnify:CR=1 FL=1
MKQDTRPSTLQRILVPLDASKHSMAALYAAAELAASQDAELLGLFVEDIHLLQLSEFPFVREVSLLGPTFRPIDRAETERHLRIQAERVRKALSEVAQRFHVRWTFKVARGGVSKEVLAEAEKADLTILGRSGQTMPRSQRVGSTVRTVLAQGRGMTLIMQHGTRFQPPVQILFSGSELSANALDVAADLCRRRAMPLVVLILDGAEHTVHRLQSRAFSIASEHGVQPTLFVIHGPTLPQIGQVVRTHGSGPLFLPCEEPHMHGECLQDLVDSLENPVFLIRPKKE